MRAWYARVLGGAPGKCTSVGAPDGSDCVDVPGVSLAMSQGETKLDPTAGRSLDHIGFEVKNLEAFTKKLEAEGIKLDRPYTKVPQLGIAVAFIKDPWGTNIEMTEGLADIK